MIAHLLLQAKVNKQEICIATNKKADAFPLSLKEVEDIKGEDS